MSRSPNFRQTKRHSNSPVPLRSPSPDFMNKSAIVHTPLTKIDKQKSNETIPIMEQLKLLRQQNNKLRQCVKNKSQIPQNTLSDIIKEKDRLIQTLKNQLKSVDSKSNKGLNLVTNSNHKHSISVQKQDGDLKYQNEELKSKIKRLIDQNNELKRKSTNLVNDSSDRKQKPTMKDDPLPYIYQQENTRNNIQRIKQQLVQKLNRQITMFMGDLNRRIQNIERRVGSIENKLLTRSKTQYSGQKQHGQGSTIGHVSPIGVSSFTNTGYQVSSFNGSDDKRIAILNKKIQALEDQLRNGNMIEHNLKLKQIELQEEINRKNDQIRILREQLNKKINIQSTLPSSGDSKAKIAQQNISMKQTISRLSAELTITKNDKTSLQKQYQLIKRQLQNEKRNKKDSFINQPDPYLIEQLNGQIQIYQQQNRQRVNQNIALQDTLNQIRRSHSQLLNQLSNIKTQNNDLRIQLGIEKQKSDLVGRVRSDSHSDIHAQTQNTNLKLRIAELQRQSNELEFTSKQLRKSNDQINSLIDQIRNLKQQIFNLQNQNSSLKKQFLKISTLTDENKMLRMTIQSHQRSKDEWAIGSNHTKNQLIKLIQQNKSLVNEVIELKNNLKMTESSLSISNERLSNFQIQFRKLEQLNNNITSKLNQTQNYKITLQRQLHQLSNQHQDLLKEYRLLQQQHIKSGNHIQQLNLQINDLINKLRELQSHLTDSKKTELQKNNQLRAALDELAEVKRLLSEMRFDSVEAIIKELQSKERIASEQRQQVSIITQQYQNQLNVVSGDNERLKKQVLEISQKYIQQKQKSDRLLSSVNHLQVEKSALNQRINKLDEIIKQYISKDNNATQIPFRSDYKQIESKYTVNEKLIQSQLLQVQNLKIPIHQAVEKLDKIAQKITQKMQKSRKFGDIPQTQSIIVHPNSIDSRKK